MILDYLGTETGRASLEKFGAEEKFYHLCEECCELYAEIVHTEIRKSSRIPKVESLQEEICDVIILLDDIWGEVGNKVLLEYETIYTKYSFFKGKVEKDAIVKSLLDNLGEAICFVTSYNNNKDALDFKICVGPIARVIWFLEEYMTFYKDGIEGIMARKQAKRDRQLAGEKF